MSFVKKKKKKKGKKKKEEGKSVKLKGAFYLVKNVVGKSSFTRNLITRVRRRYLKIPLSRRRRWGSIDVAFWTMFLSRTNEREKTTEHARRAKRRKTKRKNEHLEKPRAGLSPHITTPKHTKPCLAVLIATARALLFSFFSFLLLFLSFLSASVTQTLRKTRLLPRRQD